MSPEVLAWLAQAGGVGILAVVVYVFRNRIYFSFGQPPRGVQFRHPADAMRRGPDPAPPAIAPPRKKRRRRGRARRSRRERVATGRVDARDFARRRHP